jgi:hypothetical protein
MIGQILDPFHPSATKPPKNSRQNSPQQLDSANSENYDPFLPKFVQFLAFFQGQ